MHTRIAHLNTAINCNYTDVKMHIYKCHYINVLPTKFRSTFGSQQGSRELNIIHGQHPCTDSFIKVLITAVKDTVMNSPIYIPELL